MDGLILSSRAPISSSDVLSMRVSGDDAGGAAGEDDAELDESCSLGVGELCAASARLAAGADAGRGRGLSPAGEVGVLRRERRAGVAGEDVRVEAFEAGDRLERPLFDDPRPLPPRPRPPRAGLRPRLLARLGIGTSSQLTISRELGCNLPLLSTAQPRGLRDLTSAERPPVERHSGAPVTRPFEVAQPRGIVAI